MCTKHFLLLFKFLKNFKNYGFLNKIKYKRDAIQEKFMEINLTKLFSNTNNLSSSSKNLTKKWGKIPQADFNFTVF